MTYKIRNANIKDCELILTFIKELAAYEQMEDQVIGSADRIRETLFNDNPKAEVILLEEEAKPVGFALFFHNYSTFLCQYGVYIEDIYVRQEHRGKGYGKALFQHICSIAYERDCGRVEWACLDWNKPSIDFYINLGAKAMADWTVYRLTKKEIEKIAEEKLYE